MVTQVHRIALLLDHDINFRSFCKGLVRRGNIRGCGATWPNMLIEWAETPCMRCTCFVAYEIAYMLF